MNEDQRPKQQAQQPQHQQQLQALLRETLKENKILQSKHIKFQAKFVQVFKEMKNLKKDYAVFISFFTKYFNNQTNSQTEQQFFQELPVGQYEMTYLQKLAEQRQLVFRKRIEQLEQEVQKSQKDSLVEIQRYIKENRQQIMEDYEKMIKTLSDDRTKEVSGLLKEIQTYKKSNKNLSDQIAQLSKNLQQKNNELSKTSKQKLKLQHHLNNIRKKEIAQELSPQKQKQQQKLMNQRNQFLSLRQQVESLLVKRDELKRELKQRQQLLSNQRRNNEILQDEISRLKKCEMQMNEKYELIRQCTLEQLQNMILTHHFQASQSNGSILGSNNQQCVMVDQPKGEQSEQIQKEYLKNVLMRYIKAEIAGALDQSLMLLQVIGNILKLDAQSSMALENYKTKRKQWWYIKY